MSSQNNIKQAHYNKQNGLNGLPLQSKEKNTSSKQNNGETLKHYVVVQTKRKKEVIQISSSQSQVNTRPKQIQQPLRQYQNYERSQKSKKIKKTVSKCYLCRTQVKKSQMKSCVNCKHIFHNHCIGDQRSIPKRYVCEKCKFEKEQELREQQRKLALQQKQLTLQLEKLAPKKTQKEKKKEEFTKRLQEFNKRYPYYVQNDQKFKYPIQDKLLIIYKQLFDTNEQPKPRPKNHPLIPSHMIADFLQIENFFSTFKEQLELIVDNFPKDVRMGFLYIAMDSEVIDQIYSCMVHCLLKIYLSDIFDKNKTDNVKMLNENCFFTLLTNMHQNDDLTNNILVQSAQEIIRYLSTIPSMKKSFQDFIFPVKYNLQSKIYILVSLIKGLSEIDTFHEFVSAKSEKMQNLTKQKGQLVNQLKIDEAQNLSNQQKIKEFVNVDHQLDEQLNKNQQNGTIASTRQITRQKDKNKKKMQKLSNEKDKSLRNIHQIRAKIGQISKSLPFVTSQVIFLGSDRNESQYFFYCNEPNRLYCKFRSFILDDNEDLFIFESKQSINQLLKSLNGRGLHQKQLAETITSFVKDQIIVEKDEYKDNKDYTNVEPYVEGIYKDIAREDVVDMIFELEEKFSNYLIMKNLQWTQPAERQNFLENLKIQTNLHEFKQMIINLQQSFLFVEPVPQQIANRRITIIDSDEDDKTQKKQQKKKSPVRLWGINSQRIKKYWVQYLEQCVDFKGLWICSNILKNYVDKYVKKKMQFLQQQQKKQQKVQKQKQRQRLKKQKQDRQSQKYSRQRSREQRPQRGRRPNRISQSSQSLVQSNRPNLRQRNKKRKFQIDSDMEQQQDEYQNEQQQDYEEQEDSQSQDKCQICGEYGQMICCDTCPKVYHLECLKIKEIPQGQWNCYHCLEKMANQRQTRSRANRVQKTGFI